MSVLLRAASLSLLFPCRVTTTQNLRPPTASAQQQATMQTNYLKPTRRARRGVPRNHQGHGGETLRAILYPGTQSLSSRHKLRNGTYRKRGPPAEERNIPEKQAPERNIPGQNDHPPVMKLAEVQVHAPMRNISELQGEILQPGLDYQWFGDGNNILLQPLASHADGCLWFSPQLEPRAVLTMSRLSLFSLAVSCICFLRYSGGSLSDWETWQAFRTGDRLPGNYSKTVRPNDDERWTGVSCGVRLSDIGSLSETSMKFEARFDMTLEWTDPRLAGLTMGLAPIPIRYLWTPDIRFGQETEVLSESDSGNDMDDNTITTWIFPDGKIAYKKSYEGRIKCAMSLQSYPMDRQDCTFQIHAYNGVHLRLEPNFEWTASAPLTTDLPSVHSQFQIYSVQIRSFANSFLDTAEGKDCSYFSTECTYQPWMCGLETKDDEACQNYVGSCKRRTAICSLVSANATANTYTSLEITLSFRRLLSSHLFELFIPCVTIVCLSWVAFWINRAAVPARVALGITTVLTMVTQATRVVGMPHATRVVGMPHVSTHLLTMVTQATRVVGMPHVGTHLLTMVTQATRVVGMPHVSTHLLTMVTQATRVVGMPHVSTHLLTMVTQATRVVGMPHVGTHLLTMVTQATRVVGMPHVSTHLLTMVTQATRVVGMPHVSTHLLTMVTQATRVVGMPHVGTHLLTMVTQATRVVGRMPHVSTHLLTMVTQATRVVGMPHGSGDATHKYSPPHHGHSGYQGSGDATHKYSPPHHGHATRVVGMPHVSYVRAIDVWVLACQAFVFLALIEYAVVNYLMNNANKAKLSKAKAKPAVSPTEGLPRLENKSNLAGKPAYHAAKVDNSEKDQTASPLPTNLSKLIKQPVQGDQLASSTTELDPLKA
ncbi:Glycine receptor subunit alpha-3 [Branchiostoma belcheri]|nr:Glycine receptor subunit alpha-3 [Branchiostoma belcheri]